MDESLQVLSDSSCSSMDSYKSGIRFLSLANSLADGEVMMTACDDCWMSAIEVSSASVLGVFTMVSELLD